MQQNNQVRLIAKNIENKIKNELTEMLKEERDKYETFFKEFGMQLKHGIYSSYGSNKETLQDLLMFYSSKEDKYTTLSEYVERMTEDSKEIYYASGESLDKIKMLPQVEMLVDKGYEVLYLTEYLDEFVSLQLEILSKRVPLLSRMKDKFRRKLNETTLIDDATKYELEQRLEGMKNHAKLCHGDFNPSNIIITEKGNAYVLDWSHATQGNASGDAARTFLIFSIQGKEKLAEKYLDLFAEKSGIPKSHIQRWIPIVAATQMTKGKPEEAEFLAKWVDVIDYE
jgi:thiamine kinase-like enzyme